MLLQAALNGDRTKADHQGVPVSPEELGADAAACVAGGAGAIHVHPRDAGGGETLEPAVIDAAVRVVREACGVPVGVSTGAWIEPDLERRLELIAGWSTPDYTSVNLAEDGCLVEPMDPGAERAVAVVDEIHAALDRLGLDAPRLQHSDGEATWILIDDAIGRGIDTRVGLEDTLQGRNGALTEGNASLVREGGHGR